MSWNLILNDEKQRDFRVQSSLADLGIPYEINGAGDYEIRFSMISGRQQTGCIRSETFQFEGIELREVYAPAACSLKPFAAAVIHTLLQENIRLKLGMWTVVRDEETEEYSARFRVRIPATTHGTQLMAVLSGVLRVANEMERRLTAIEGN